MIILDKLTRLKCFEKIKKKKCLENVDFLRNAACSIDNSWAYSGFYSFFEGQ